MGGHENLLMFEAAQLAAVGSLISCGSLFRTSLRLAYSLAFHFMNL